jgi:hypothetical protein
VSGLKSADRVLRFTCKKCQSRGWQGWARLYHIAVILVPGKQCTLPRTKHFIEKRIMPKPKRPPGKKSSAPSEDKADTLAQKLCDLAIELVEQEDSESMADSLKQTKSEFHKIIRKSIYQKKNDILLESLERTRYADSSAYQFLKENIEEASGVILIRDDEGNSFEVNAFVIPIFAHTTGGLDSAQCFQDEEAFDLLTGSFKEAQLESPDASVVLVSHAYHLDEINRIGYSQLNEMVYDAHASMTRKKLTATPAIGRSIAGWPENPFEPQDHAVELRFLLGFALKKIDDAFYRVPEDDDAADAWFEAREERFRRWTEKVAPLVKRCLVTDGREIDVNFLYQDLFHGGRDHGIAEYDMLQMMSELHHSLQEHGVEPESTKAIMGFTEVPDEMVLRVNLYAEKDGALVASSEKPVDAVRDPQVEAADAYDALMTLGVKSIGFAEKFDSDGQALDVRPYEA